MKRIIFIFSLIISTTAIAQTANTLELEKQKLRQALLYGDQAVATSAMYSIIAIEGEQSTYKDSLAYMYFNRRSYLSCYIVADEVLERDANNAEMLEMTAVSLESLGAKDKAIERYSKLLPMSNNNYHAYKIAVLESELNKFEDALVSIKKADQLADNGAEQISYQINNNYNQNVPLKSAIAYTEGIILLNLAKNTEAKTSFERAVNLFPDFVLAKERLAALVEETTPKE